MLTLARLPVVVALLLVAASAAAQDRLFVSVPDAGTGVSRTVEIGAIGRFGQRLGVAPSNPAAAMPPRVLPFTATATAVLRAFTGRVVWTAPPGETIAIQIPLVATPDESRLFVTTTAGTGFNAGFLLSAVDADTGATVARSGLSSPQLDPIGRRLIFTTFDAGPRFTVLDFDLNVLGTFSPGPSRCAPSMFVSAHTERAYVAYTLGSSSYGPTDTRLMAIDLRQSRVVNDVSLVQSLGLSDREACPPAITLWSAPGAPARLASTLTGREVTLSWTSVELAAGYVLDIGGAPGRTDATIDVGNTTRVIFANPPSGTFYVRVRAGNRMGGGRPSTEVRVVVP